MRHPGFIQIMETHDGDWWVVDDIRVIGVHLEGPGDAPGTALARAQAQAEAASDNGRFALYRRGTVPRCHASNLLHGYAEEPGADPAVVCWRGGWFDEDEPEGEYAYDYDYDYEETG